MGGLLPCAPSKPPFRKMLARECHFAVSTAALIALFYPHAVFRRHRIYSRCAFYPCKSVPSADTLSTVNSTPYLESNPRLDTRSLPLFRDQSDTGNVADGRFARASTRQARSPHVGHNVTSPNVAQTRRPTHWTVPSNSHCALHTPCPSPHGFTLLYTVGKTPRYGA